MTDVVERAVHVLDDAAAGLPPADVDAAAAFLRRYYAGSSPADLVERSPLDLCGAGLAQWRLAADRTLGSPCVRVYTPSFEEHGWQSVHSVVDIVADDMPFLVDSLTMAVSRAGFGIHFVLHAAMPVDRDGPTVAVRADGPRDAFVHVEFDRQTDDAALGALRDDVVSVLGDVARAVEDWEAMRAKAIEIADSIGDESVPEGPDQVEEVQALLRWMAANHYTFLGYREYDLVDDAGEMALRSVAGSGLGIRRDDDTTASQAFERLPAEGRARAREPEILILTKANARSTVHRPSHLDYVGIKRFDADGRVVGERRFLGLYTSVAYNTSPTQIPILRRKVEQVLDRSGLERSSHGGKDLLAILETYPRDELFEVTDGELFDAAMGILHLQERRLVRVFLRREKWGRFYSCLVYLPRDRYATDSRTAVQDVLMDALDGVAIEFNAHLSESVLARLHFVVRTAPGATPDVDADDIQRRVEDAVRSWVDDLEEALVEACGEERGTDLFRVYADAFPAGYRDDFVTRVAVSDLLRVEALDPGGTPAVNLYRPLGAARDVVRFKVYRLGDPLALSDVLPVLQDLGVQVVDERPYHLEPSGGSAPVIYDFGLRVPAGVDLEEGDVRDRFQEAFARAWAGEVDSDRFNRLVLLAGLDWREVGVIRAYAAYRRQTVSRFSQSYMEEALAAHPGITAKLVGLFLARFDPDDQDEGADRAQRLTTEIERDLDAVESLDEDLILRGFLRLLLATLRTNYFQRDAEDRCRPYLALKFDPAKVPNLPAPRPVYEISVHSPRVEGVHLRGGKVARGGLRWSDRREDYRTEILGLVKAQAVKNTAIVPVGAKGGFVVKDPPSDRDDLRAEVLACYRWFVSGLLDLTDNFVDDEVVRPARVVAYDDDDPYLVVAADKGTATFSDVANGIAAEYGFWLGDAFASGGSSGYDHKVMGITARGAWESVKRHFRELGLDTQDTAFTVVGIGDMSGDVFGNGMLLSRHIRLVAAFDHRHVFLDPDPDPEASHGERERLFGLERSSWDDYDASLVSEGGGVYPRTAKSIPITAQVAAVLDIADKAMTPNDLIKAILAAPVDLLWNGGIGTYVKARSESHADVGDKANDAVRVDGCELRCRVVGEGGNLGCTQQGRIEFALAGGRIHTDAIDNSAGVGCSDREVNIKILLNAVVESGDLTLKQRNDLLEAMTDEVADLVLADNYAQTEALTTAQAQANSMLDVHDRYIRSLEVSGRLDPHLERLPDAEAIVERNQQGSGLTSPEFAVLLAYAKMQITDDLLASDIPDDPWFERDLERYFPGPLRAEYADRMLAHRLRREIVATRVTSRMVDAAGTTFGFRLEEETSASSSDIVRAYTVAREVFALDDVRAQVDALDNDLDAAVQTVLRLAGRRLVERGSRWLLRARRPPIDISGVIEELTEPVRLVASRLVDLLAGTSREAVLGQAQAYRSAGVPDALALRVAGFGALYSALDIADVAGRAGVPVDDAARVYFLIGERLEFDWLREHVADLPRDDRWETLARAALRDDLYREYADLTAAVLGSSPMDEGPDRLVEDWVSENRAEVDRVLGTLEAIRAAGTYDLTTLSVGVREARSLA